MNWFLDVFADDENDSSCHALTVLCRLQDSDRSGPCEDDIELTAPYVGILPEETSHEHPSPLRF